MAKKNSGSHNKKKPLEYLPVRRKMYLSSTASPASTVGLIDAGRILSTSNHRLYRYGKRYSMKVDMDPQALQLPTAQIDVWALADTWAVQKAFEEAYDAYDKSYEDERENISKEARARWFDFRINPGVAGDLLYSTVKPDPTDPVVKLTGGEFDASIVVDSAGTTRTFSWDPSTTAGNYSVPAEYDLSGNTNSAPTTPTGSGPYADLQADAHPAEMDAIQSSGNLPPYEANSFPAVWVKIATLQTSNGTSSNGVGKLTTGYFDAPCGVVVLNSSQGMDQLSEVISVQFQAGDYKGVRAHNMHREGMA
jgi:hypothetical protein